MKANHPWKRGYIEPSRDSECQVHSTLALIGFHRYRLNISQESMAALLKERFNKTMINLLTTAQLETFLFEIEKAQSIQELN